MTTTLIRPALPSAQRQQGLVLFFALIALLVLSLAAAALIRSVDTSTMVAGNLAFKQAATSAGDAGIEAAITWLAQKRDGETRDIFTDPQHTLNQDHLTANSESYYSSVHDDPADPAYIDLFSDANWANDSKSVFVGTDAATGNTTRYIIQRLCRDPNKTIVTAGCLFAGGLTDNNGQHIPLLEDVCAGPGCPTTGQTPLIRITSRVTGPKNTVSYVQAFVY
ncbi:MAG: hypothetical protein LBE33_00150 [Zoogloeaceae bacterium]|jgi:hypothetical protein|nr:hypothetical protein [Zoogloeaceae bacterium]